MTQAKITTLQVNDGETAMELVDSNSCICTTEPVVINGSGTATYLLGFTGSTSPWCPRWC